MGARLEPPVGACDLSGAGGTAVATISSLLADHVTLQVRSVDRIFLAGYVPRLQCDGQLVRVLNDRAGGTIPSPAILGKIGRRGRLVIAYILVWPVRGRGCAPGLGRPRARNGATDDPTPFRAGTL